MALPYHEGTDVLGIISGIGSLYKVTGTGQTTLSVTPSTLGDSLVLGITLGAGTLTSVSGGGVTTWTKIAGPFAPSGYSASSTQLWIGKITTTGAQTITIAGTSITNTNRLTCRQFSAAGGGTNTTWLQDGSGANLETDSTASTTVPFATLVPSAPNRLYIGYGPVGSTANTTGQTSGYTVDTDSGTNPFMWNPNVSASQSPTCVQASANHATNVAALVYALVPPYGAFMPFFGM